MLLKQVVLPLSWCFGVDFKSEELFANNQKCTRGHLAGTSIFTAPSYCSLFVIAFLSKFEHLSLR